MNEEWIRNAGTELWEMMETADEATGGAIVTTTMLAKFRPPTRYEVTVRRLPSEPDQRPDWLRQTTAALSGMTPHVVEKPTWQVVPDRLDMTRHCTWEGCRYYQIAVDGTTSSGTQHLCKRGGDVWVVTWPAK